MTCLRLIWALVVVCLLTSVAVLAQNDTLPMSEYAQLADRFRRAAALDDLIPSEKIDEMHALYRQTGELPEDIRRLAALALGAHYLPLDHLKSLQYTTSAEMLTPKEHELYAVVKYFQISARLQSGAYALAVRDAQQLLKMEPGKAWEEKLYPLLTEGLEKNGQLAEVTALYERYERKIVPARRSETVMQKAAMAYETMGKLPRAAEVLEDLAGNYPVTELSRWAFRQLQELRCRPDGKQIRYSKEFLLTLARNATLDVGTEEFIVAALDEPIRLSRRQTGTLVGIDRLEFLFLARLYDDALAYAKQLYAREVRRKNSAMLADLQILMGRINFRLRDYQQSARYFAEFLTQFPGNRHGVNVQEYLADTYKRLDAFRLAADHYAGVAGKTRDREIRWAHFWNLYRNRDYQKALNVLEVPNYVSGRARSDGDEVLYWRARLLGKLDRHAEAMVLYTDILKNFGSSFYAHLIVARHPELLDLQPHATNKAASPTKKDNNFRLAARLLKSDGDDGVTENFASTPELRAIRALYDLGLRQPALNQLTKLRWNDYDEEHLFASAGSIALSLGDYQPSRRLKYRAFSALRALPASWWALEEHQQAHSQEWQIYYPKAFDEPVRDISSRVGVDPYFLMSIMRAESFYNKDARSPVGAQGLMQIMPYTGARIAKLLGDHSFQASDLSIPGVSVVYGGYYMKKLLSYYKDNFMLAAAAYNAGPDAVNRWISFCSGCEIDEFIESIPYRETRRYVMKVLGNLAVYRRIYEGERSLPTIPELPKTLPENENIF